MMSGAFDAGTITGRLILDLNDWTANVEKAKADTTSLAGVVNAKKEDIEKLGKAFTAVGAAIVGSIGLMVKSAMNFTLEAGRMADRTGIAVETISGLREAADDAEVSMDDLSGGFRRYAALAADAAGGNKTAQDTFAKLGIQVLDSNGKMKAMDELLLEAADRFKGMEGGVEKAALAQDLFGRGGMAMIPIMNKGAEGIRAYTEDVRRSGQMVTNEGVEKMRAFRIAMDNLDDAFMSVKLAIATALLPVIQTLAGAFTTIINVVRNVMNIFPPLGNAIVVVVGIFGALMSVLGPMLLLLPKLVSAFTMFSAILPIVTKGILAFVAAVGPIGIGIMAAAAAVQAITSATNKYSAACDDAMAAISKTADVNKRNWEFIRATIHGENAKIAESIKGAVKEFHNLGYSSEEIGNIIYAQFGKIAGAAKKVAVDTAEMAGKVLEVERDLEDKLKSLTLGEYDYRIFQARRYYDDLKTQVKGSVNESKIVAQAEKAYAIEVAKIKGEQAEAAAAKHKAALEKQKKADADYQKSVDEKLKSEWQKRQNFDALLVQSAKDANKGVTTSFETAFNAIGVKLSTTSIKMKTSFSDTASKINQTIQTLQAGFSDFFSGISKLSEQRFQRESDQMDAEYAKQKLAIENSMMSETEKSAALEKLDTEYAEKKKVLEIKQAEANKKSSLMQAVVNTALAVTSALSTKPFFPLGLIAAAAALAAGYIQVRVIQAQAIPQMAEGGIVTRATNIIAGEAGPEAIIPLNKMMGGNTINVRFDIRAIDSSGVRDFVYNDALPYIQNLFRQERLLVPPKAVRYV
jgi:flagellar biosynthesis protein FliQ